MTETPEEFAARPIWEPYETIMATAENIEALRAEFQLDRMKIGSTCYRRKPEHFYPNTSEAVCWFDADGVRWIPHGEYRRRA